MRKRNRLPFNNHRQSLPRRPHPPLNPLDHLLRHLEDHLHPPVHHPARFSNHLRGRSPSLSTSLYPYHPIPLRRKSGQGARDSHSPLKRFSMPILNQGPFPSLLNRRLLCGVALVNASRASAGDSWTDRQRPRRYLRRLSSIHLPSRLPLRHHPLLPLQTPSQRRSLAYLHSGKPHWRRRMKPRRYRRYLRARTRQLSLL